MVAVEIKRCRKTQHRIAEELKPLVVVGSSARGMSHGAFHLHKEGRAVHVLQA
jgi:hypothetical protein